MRITITGDPGSGKGTISNLIIDYFEKKKINYEYYSLGSIFRDFAKKYDMDITEFISELNKASSDSKHKFYGIDKQIDKYQKNLSKKDNIIVDSRLGFYFIYDSFKIYLKVSLKEAANRIFLAKRNDEKGDIIEIYNFVKKRKQDEVERYKKLYDVDLENMKNFDLVIDTTTLTIDEVFKKVISEIEKRL